MLEILEGLCLLLKNLGIGGTNLSRIVLGQVEIEAKNSGLGGRVKHVNVRLILDRIYSMKN